MVRFIIDAPRGYGPPNDDLHSNMVRFIIINMNAMTLRDLKIYIPIWLDLL